MLWPGAGGGEASARGSRGASSCSPAAAAAARPARFAAGRTQLCSHSQAPCGPQGASCSRVTGRWGTGSWGRQSLKPETFAVSLRLGLKVWVPSVGVTLFREGRGTGHPRSREIWRPRDPAPPRPFLRPAQD